MTSFKYYSKPNQEHQIFTCYQKYIKRTTLEDPFINSVGSLTETISALVDEILRKYSKLAKSYIKDTSHFLQEIQKIEIHPGDIIAKVGCHGFIH